jgi:hypothetical protein
MSGGVAGYGAGSAGNAVEVDTVFDDAREQVAGIKRKRDRLKREHEVVEAEFGTAESITLKRKRDRLKRAHEDAEDELHAAEAILGVLEAAEAAEKAAVALAPVVEAVEECPVCIEDMTLADRFKMDPCKHEVCERCVNRLLFQGHLVCPLCRKPIKFYDPVVLRDLP